MFFNRILHKESLFVEDSVKHDLQIVLFHFYHPWVHMVG